MKKLGNAIWIVISFACCILMLLTAVIPFIPPTSYASIFSNLSIAFPFIFVLTLICWITCLIRRQWYTSICLFLMLLLNFPNVQKSFGFHPVQTQAPTEQSIKILSYNVHYFNFFNRKEENALHFLTQTDADIICLQEFSAGAGDKHNIRQLNFELRDYPYRHIAFFSKGKVLNKGIATYSKYPIIQREKVNIDSPTNGAISTYIQVGKDTLQVVNYYLESNRLTEQEKKIYSSTEKTDLFKRIYNKLGSASRVRGFQVQEVSKIQNPNLPSILCGDMNDVPTSYPYQVLAKKNTDAFLHLRRGPGNTFYEKIYRFRIDYLFTSPRIEPLLFDIEKQKFSDHYPISLQFNIK